MQFNPYPSLKRVAQYEYDIFIKTNNTDIYFEIFRLTPERYFRFRKDLTGMRRGVQLVESDNRRGIENRDNNSLTDEEDMLLNMFIEEMRLKYL
jgi:hypothetical protein